MIDVVSTGFLFSGAVIIALEFAFVVAFTYPLFLHFLTHMTITMSLSSHPLLLFPLGFPVDDRRSMSLPILFLFLMVNSRDMFILCERQSLYLRKT